MSVYFAPVFDALATSSDVHGRLDHICAACVTLFRVKATQSSRWMAVFDENLDFRVKIMGVNSSF